MEAVFIKHSWILLFCYAIKKKKKKKGSEAECQAEENVHMVFHRLMSLPITASSNNTAGSWPLLLLSSRRLRRAELAGRGAGININIGQRATPAHRSTLLVMEKRWGGGGGGSWMVMKGPV